MAYACRRPIFAGKTSHIMKKIVTVYGLIAGAVVSILMIISMRLMQNKGDQAEHSLLLGYASMLLAFCFILIAVKNYRDKHLGGTISFGKVFTTGLCIAVVASVCYTISWVIFYKGFYPDFMDQYTAHELTKLQQSGKSGKSAVEIARETQKMEKMQALYATWPGLIGFTLLEIFPVGLLMSLVAALIFKRKVPGPAAQPHAGAA